MSKQPFQTDVPQLITRLGHNLYSDPLVAVRELVQNANDACIIATGLYRARTGRIDIEIDKSESTISVKDTGVGMTETDLRSFLSTIASSNKSEVRKRLEEADFQGARGIAGRFGIGFLSSFIVADHISIETRHIKDLGLGTLWESKGDGFYELKPSKSALRRGTTVKLHVKSDYSKLLDPVAISETLLTHCPYIPTRYFLNKSTLPLNNEPPPWEEPEDTAIGENYLQQQFQTTPLVDFHISYDGPLAPSENSDGKGEKVREVSIRGYFAIPRRTVYGHPALHVYTSGIWVGKIESGLPPWASFIVGGLECPDLDLTLGRDNIMRDVTWIAVRRHIAKELAVIIVDSLKNKRSRLRASWKTVFRAHGEHIKRAAVDDAIEGEGLFFEAVRNVVPFQIGEDMLSIEGAVAAGLALEKDGKKIFFYLAHGYRAHESSGVQEQLLFDESDLGFIDAKNYYDRDFLQQYSRAEPAIEMVPIEDGVEYLLDFECPEREKNLVKDVYSSVGLRARLCQFDPSEMAAVIILVEDEETDRPMHDPSTPTGRKALMEALSGRSGSRVSLPYTLCVNSRNRLVQALVEQAKQHGVDTNLRAAFRQIYFMSVLLFGDTHNQIIAEMAPGLAHMMLAFIKRANEQDEELARARAELDGIESDLSANALAVSDPVDRKVPGSVFVAYGYNAETEALVGPFIKMLQSHGMKVVDGKVDRVGSLSKQILQRISGCEQFVCVLTAKDAPSGRRKGGIPSTWLLEEKGAALAMGVPVLVVSDERIATKFFGNLEGDSVYLRVGEKKGEWVKAFQTAVEMICNTAGGDPRE